MSKKQLSSCYHSCFDAAASENLRSIAFCCISTGIFGFPQDEAAEIAVQTVRDWLEHNGSDMIVVCNVFGKKDEWINYSLLEI